MEGPPLLEVENPNYVNITQAETAMADTEDDPWEYQMTKYLKSEPS